MLQQTPVRRVIPKYREFLRRYPTLDALAAARPSEVRRTWRPLGYNIRPLRLQGIAGEAVERYGGRLPSTRGELLSFKGIGPYTAGALLSFGFGKRAPILDTNIRRVLSRVFFAGDAPSTGNGPRSGPSERRLWELSGRLLPRKRFYDFNQAIMDFGATVCRARNPLCPSCPMSRICVYPMKTVLPADGTTRGGPAQAIRRRG